MSAMTSDTAAEVLLTPTELHRLREEARDAGRSLVDLLADRLQIKPRQAGSWLAERFAMLFWDSLQLNPMQARFDLWPLARAIQQRSVIVEGLAVQAEDGHGLVSVALFAVVSDPFDTDLLTQLEQAVGQTIIQVLCTAEDIHAYLNQQESSLSAVDSLVQVHRATEADSTIQVLSLTSATEAASPAVKLVNSTLYDALRANASDVHLESTPSGLAVRYRIDGVLDEITQIHDRTVAEQAISRLKVLAELDIAERRVPQDGSFQVRTLGRLIDLRVSIMPSIHGEDAVIRILDKQAMIESHGKLSLEALGFDASALKIMRQLTEAAYG
ncbi:MAG: GspE/PulE family protein, partial [Polaromonas sp.]